jgi:hypothetical protein
LLGTFPVMFLGPSQQHNCEDALTKLVTQEEAEPQRDHSPKSSPGAPHLPSPQLPRKMTSLPA